MGLQATKKKVPVLIYTATHRIEGMYHAHETARLLDDLNGRQKEFVPLTDVKVGSLQNENQSILEAEFVAVNIHNITLFCPDPKFTEQ